MIDYTAYFNGGYVPYSQVKIDPADRGFSLGDVVFDTGRTFDGAPFRLNQHIDRLYRSLTYVRIDSGLTDAEMTGITEEVLSRNEQHRPAVGDFTYTQFVTRGTGGVGGGARPTVCVRVSPVGFDRSAKAYREGVHGVITKIQSYSPASVDPKIKHWSRMNFVLADLEANDVETGALAILTDGNRNITEGTGSNVFVVTNGVLRTAKDDALLQGVSRGMVFDLARQLDIPLVEEDIQAYDLYTADEAFFSTTSPCIMPMTRVDRRPVGDGRPGPITMQLLAAWGELVGVDIIDQAMRFAKAGG